MKSISKPTGARSQRTARASVGLSTGTRRKTHVVHDLAFEDVADELGAMDWDIDLDAIDCDGVDDGDSASGDWLADRDLALEIAQRALH